MKIIKPVNKLSDERGYLIEIMQNGLWKQINHSFTKKGNKRGNHYHKYCHEFFYIIDGELKITIRNINTKEQRIAIMKRGDCFIIEPYEIHIVEALTDLELVVLLSSPFDPENPDLFREDGTQQN
ncbi:MAG: cupin domain-containing protein [Candidatus Woesearchaeota archaeon]